MTISNHLDLKFEWPHIQTKPCPAPSLPPCGPILISLGRLPVEIMRERLYILGFLKHTQNRGSPQQKFWSNGWSLLTLGHQNLMVIYNEYYLHKIWSDWYLDQCSLIIKELGTNLLWSKASWINKAWFILFTLDGLDKYIIMNLTK